MTVQVLGRLFNTVDNYATTDEGLLHFNTTWVVSEPMIHWGAVSITKLFPTAGVAETTG
jgi:hypothetical protein